MPVEIFLRDAVVLLAAAVAVVLVSHRLRLPAVVGLLLTGLLIGPSGLALISEVEQVELFAEIGVLFLLFSVGLEFSLERLKEVRRPFFLGGSVQCLLTISAVALLGLALDFVFPQALFFGFLIALSSTAIVLKLYSDRRELATPQGKLIIGILFFQDFLMVPMIVLTPLLAGTAEASPVAFAGRFLGALVAVALVFAVARHLMPRLLFHLVRTRIRELLVLGALLACLGMALLTEFLEFSLALGAFLAGIIVSESEYSHQVVAEMSPFRDTFTSVFFISIGMLLDLEVAVANLPQILGLAAVIFAVKVLTGGTAAWAVGYPPRITVLVALGLAQVGEFSFLVLEVGRAQGLVGPEIYQAFLGAAILTMLATPGLVAAAPAFGLLLGRRVGEGQRLVAELDERLKELRDHVAIVGFGVAGRNLARVLREARIPYAVVELNGETVRHARREEEPILFGDATRPDILRLAGVQRANVVVFVISDLRAVRLAIRSTRQLNPRAHIIVRTRMVAEIEELQRRGADEVIAEEFETSIEIFTRVLQRYHVPRNVIRAETRALRGEGYKMLRAPAMAEGLPEKLAEILAAGTADVFLLGADSPVVGKTLRLLDLRRQTGATAIAVLRGETPHLNPPAAFELAAGDSLVLVGSHAEIDAAFAYLERGGPPPDAGAAPAPAPPRPGSDPG